MTCTKTLFNLWHIVGTKYVIGLALGKGGKYVFPPSTYFYLVTS